mmetsp:Transcript_42057/g.101129  ORF Transcript_42057/g.101129 Transcript_42057/m.101129 type:complete len:150 (-) Transcript_42057:1733-2182(-)
MAPTPTTPTLRRSKRTLTMKSSSKTSADAAGGASGRPPFHPSTSKKNLSSSTAVVASTSKRGHPQGQPKKYPSNFGGLTEELCESVFNHLMDGKITDIYHGDVRIKAEKVPGFSLPPEEEEVKQYFGLPPSPFRPPLRSACASQRQQES